MSSTEADKPTPAPEPVKAAPPPEVPALEVQKEAPPPESKGAEATHRLDLLVVADVVLRVLLFLAAVAAVVVMVTSKETKLVPSPIPPFGPVLQHAKFNHSPAFIYFVAALSAAGLYSIITTAVSFFALLKPGCFTKYLAHFVILDVIILGIVASATGAAGAVAYIGLKGNSHVGWTKVCNVYHKYCKHLGASVAVALFGSVVLVLLVILSAYSLSKKIPR